jgi:hypothetical protein
MTQRRQEKDGPKEVSISRNLQERVQHKLTALSFRPSLLALPFPQQVREFQPGELMFDDATVTSRAGKAVIFYIESGTAEYTYDENSKRHSNLCMPRGMNFIGQGDFYGVSHHLLNGQNSAFWSGRKLTAFTKSKVRVVRLSPLEDGFTISDLHVDGLTEVEDAGMWKMIAMGEHRFATDAQSFLDLIHKQVDTMDHDLTADVDLRSTLKQFVRGEPSTLNPQP